jgi:hypothetical protein
MEYKMATDPYKLYTCLSSSKHKMNHEAPAVVLLNYVVQDTD